MDVENLTAVDDLDFLPCGRRVARLDTAARAHFAASLHAAIEACDGYLTWSEAALATATHTIASHPIRAEIFAIYIALVDAIFRDDFTAAQPLADELLSTALAPAAGRQIRTIGDPTHEIWAARYRAIIAADPENEAVHLPFTTAELPPAIARLGQAFDLIATGVPALAGELDILLREIVLTHRLTPRGLEPDITGASSFYLWGAAFINFTDLPPRLAVAEALVHEAAHSLLFGMTLGEPLVTNDPAERYDSPLREDQRPMDGLVHAAYVLARLTFFLTELLRTDLLTDAETSQAGAQLTRHRQGFASAAATIRTHATFTPTGHTAFAAAAVWMTR